MPREESGPPNKIREFVTVVEGKMIVTFRHQHNYVAPTALIAGKHAEEVLLDPDRAHEMLQNLEILHRDYISSCNLVSIMPVDPI